MMFSSSVAACHGLQGHGDTRSGGREGLASWTEISRPNANPNGWGLEGRRARGGAARRPIGNPRAVGSVPLYAWHEQPWHNLPYSDAIDAAAAISTPGSLASGCILFSSSQLVSMSPSRWSWLRRAGRRGFLAKRIWPSHRQVDFTEDIPDGFVRAQSEGQGETRNQGREDRG